MFLPTHHVQTKHNVAPSLLLTGMLLLSQNPEGDEQLKRTLVGEVLLVRPAVPDWRSGLVTGSAIAAAYEAWMEAEAFAGCGNDVIV